MVNIVKQESIFRGGQEIALFRISNSSGAYAEVTNIGASVVSIVVPDKKGVLSNVVLRYNKLEDYLSDTFYLGATIGRVSNRISNACFSMDSIVYHLDKNDGKNSNHGGFNGLNKKIFNYYINNESVTFYTESPDGEGGFPGNLKLRVTYSFSDTNDLQIEYKALSDKRTSVNFTNHAYFNLSSTKNTILDNQLKVNAEKYLETDNEFLPTGRILYIKNTAFDFSDYRTVNEMSLLKKDNLEGYNAYFIRQDNKEVLGSVKDITSGRVLDVYSTMPGILFYTGDFLTGQFLPFQGLCLEAQYYPDAMNHTDFASNILEPKEEKTDVITYSFR
ncbi:MAG: galactose mutarotase [Prevotella sp.]|jgi:aldose 1-epimerase|nr:galactose mutarotase [Prevotella sp.]